MKATLRLNNPLWQTPERQKLLDKVVQQSGAELESEIKQAILGSVPSGRLYRRGAITKAASQKNLALGLRRAQLQPKRVIAGSRFHRASAKGQAPAVDSGALLGSIRAKKVGQLSVKVATSKRYAVRLDDKNKLNRPFFESTAEKFRPKFKQNIREAIQENS